MYLGNKRKRDFSFYFSHLFVSLQNRNLRIKYLKDDLPMIHYYKDTPQGRIWYSGFIKNKDGRWTSNPSKEILDSEGWKSFEPDSPSLYMGDEPLLEDVKLKKLFNKHPECKDIVKLINTGLVYHYSTWDVLFKGILSSENVNNRRAVLRAYSVKYMNDSSEGLNIPRGLSRSEDRSIEGKESIIVTKDGTEVTCPAIEHPLYQRRKQIEEINAHNNKQRLFSVSFSKESDSLPMWNYYGHDGHGLSIGFDAHQIVNQGYDLVECIYDEALTETLAKYMFDCDYWISEPGPLTLDLNIISKDSHFEYEKECRIPLRQHYGNYCITKRNQFHPIKYDLKRGVISPYVEVFVPLEAIQEIWVGPTNDIDLAVDSLRGWLNSIGMSWVKIMKSSAPLK
jgi:hypothetical protein